MNSYYESAARIRYYAALPHTVEKADNGVWGEAEFVSDWSGFQVSAVPCDQPFDLTRRKEPVHERLANMALDSGSLYAFTKQWGFLAGDVDVASGRFRTRPHHIQKYQDLLRRGWRGEGKPIKDMAKDIVARIEVGRTGIEIGVVDLWSLVRLLFVRDYVAGETRICARDDCPTPYFLLKRRGQKYCTHDCAVVVNVRRFRARTSM